MNQLTAYLQLFKQALILSPERSEDAMVNSHSAFRAPGNQSKELNPANKVSKRISILFFFIGLTSIMSRGLKVAIGRFIRILLCGPRVLRASRRVLL